MCSSAQHLAPLRLYCHVNFGLDQKAKLQSFGTSKEDFLEVGRSTEPSYPPETYEQCGVIECGALLISMIYTCLCPFFEKLLGYYMQVVLHTRLQNMKS